MATTRTTVDAIKRSAVDAYRDGRAMGMSHGESIERAVSFTAMPRVTVAEWVARYA